MEWEIYSEAELKHQARQERRMRLLRGVRGWLYETRSPRWRTAGLLTISLLAGGIVALGLFWGGVRSIPWMCFAGVVASWPVFESLLRWQAAQMIRCLDTIGNARRFIIRDDAMERDVFSDTNIRYESDFRRSIRAGLSGGNQGGSCTGGNSGGAAGLPILITLGLLTLGTWLLWNLVKQGPTLLAETVVDEVFPRRHPQAAASVHTEPWLQNTLAVTGFHFIGFALCLSGAVLSILLWLPPPIATH
jgi:hypothetical protein